MSTNLGEGDQIQYLSEEEKSDLLFGKEPTKVDPELDNFLQKVDEISAVISSLTSSDPLESERGLRKADILLGKLRLGEGDVDEAYCKVTQDRTLINNKKVTDTSKDPSSSQDAESFLRFMEKDVEQRDQNRKERKIRSDELRKKGNILFAKQDYAGALKNYNEAIELIKDSPCLYNNRALTYIRLGLFSSAIEDCDKALFLEEHSLRARMFKAKAYFLMGEARKCREAFEEAMKKLPGHVEMIQDYHTDLFNMEVRKPFNYDLDQEKVWQAAARYEGTEHPVRKTRKDKDSEKEEYKPVQTQQPVKTTEVIKMKMTKEDLEVDEAGGGGDLGQFQSIQDKKEEKDDAWGEQVD